MINIVTLLVYKFDYLALTSSICDRRKLGPGARKGGKVPNSVSCHLGGSTRRLAKAAGAEPHG